MPRATGVFGRSILAASLAAAIPSWALWEDKLEVFAQENITRDNNVFRLSEGTDAAAEIGTSQRSDTIYTTSLGFLLDVPYSLQRWQLAYTWFDARFKNFDDVNHRGHIGRAAWLWSVTPHLTGDVGYQTQRALASFANIQGRRPDLVTQRMAWANAAWMMLPSWRLHAAANAAEAKHTGEREIHDIELAAGEVGLSYVTAAENRLGVAVRQERGRNPRERLVFGLPFDNEYRQESAGIQGRWVVTGLSRFDGRVDYTRRRYEQFENRDYSGPTFNFTYTYTPTGKLTIATVAQRDIAPLEEITSSFVLVTSLTVRPDWAITDKINLRGHFAYSRWEYFGDQLLSQDFEHRVRHTGVTLFYRPTRRIALSTGVTREVRTSSLSGADYTVDTVMVEGRIGF